ncbi:ABC transporter ATP-binding protein [Streptomyces phaeoluteigriseus]|uniref:ABC transporter ATP-binding protein n=1 Tax=Streptomyces phaeoluteigriseus TaxID=114686 RepID=A0ABY4ZKU7_9ACTN|nr:ABC transporter ATP-binding protein [Streptomyces phaeoluteigriseus]USQ89560.1 ABC transporter ATP-binding protein [Streptomyces phaeoluteigriseus]
MRTTGRTATGPTAGSQAAPPALHVRDVTVRFAGLTALDAVSFTVAPGSVHALIGPNGAGKSTCFNVLSGLCRPAAGQVLLGDTDLTGLAPHRIAALGVARTFQNIVTTEGTVADNLMLGRHALSRAGFAASALRLPSAVREQRAHLDRVREIAELTGLGAHVDTPVALLSYGDRKRVELARALCLEPRVLLLDEPVAGMNGVERAATADVVRTVREQLGLSVVLVEHDMGLVMRLADEVTVLDFGRRLAHGTPDEIRRHPEVLRAYLGTGAPDEAPKIPEAAETPEAAAIPETPQIPETAQIPEAAAITETTETTKATEATKATRPTPPTEETDVTEPPGENAP